MFEISIGIFLIGLTSCKISANIKLYFGWYFMYIKLTIKNIEEYNLCNND